MSCSIEQMVRYSLGQDIQEMRHSIHSTVPKAPGPLTQLNMSSCICKETSLLPYRCIIPRKGRIGVVNHYSLSINDNSLLIQREITFQTMKSNSNFGSNKLFIKQGQGSTE